MRMLVCSKCKGEGSIIRRHWWWHFWSFVFGFKYTENCPKCDGERITHRPEFEEVV